MAFTTAAKLSCDDSLLRLAHKAAMHKADGLDYAGEISPLESFDYIKQNQSVVVDVRTAPEWQFIGVPDLSATPSKLLTLSWKIYPSFALNTKFISDLNAETYITKNTPLFFICRSGGRSLDAALAATADGYSYCFNITDGFEGDVDANRHRGTESGWKHDNLPWVQG
jgi:rhodanese-related sulfurtransferase